MLGSLFNKIAGFQALNFIKKWLQHICFLLNMKEFLRTPIKRNTSKPLFLYQFDALN